MNSPTVKECRELLLDDSLYGSLIRSEVAVNSDLDFTLLARESNSALMCFLVILAVRDLHRAGWQASEAGYAGNLAELYSRVPSMFPLVR
jgi:hypothetical protein